MNKPELRKWLKEEQEKWDLIIAAIGETRMAQVGVNGDWSMQDIVAHLTGWQRWLVIRLQAAAAGPQGAAQQQARPDREQLQDGSPVTDQFAPRRQAG